MKTMVILRMYVLYIYANVNKDNGEQFDKISAIVKLFIGRKKQLKCQMLFARFPRCRPFSTWFAVIFS